jgi:hypothetical protein
LIPPLPRLHPRVPSLADQQLPGSRKRKHPGKHERTLRRVRAAEEEARQANEELTRYRERDRQAQQNNPPAFIQPNQPQPLVWEQSSILELFQCIGHITADAVDQLVNPGLRAPVDFSGVPLVGPSQQVNVSAWNPAVNESLADNRNDPETVVSKSAAAESVAPAVLDARSPEPIPKAPPQQRASVPTAPPLSLEERIALSDGPGLQRRITAPPSQLADRISDSASSVAEPTPSARGYDRYVPNR